MLETMPVGKVVVSAKIENVIDLYAASKGQIPDEQVRRIDVANALVDTGATHLGMPRKLIDQLGLPQVSTGRARTTAGPRTFGIFGPVRLTLQDRVCSVDVAEVADDCPALIGCLPLESLDFAVNPQRQRLTGNPEHDGECMFDMF